MAKRKKNPRFNTPVGTAVYPSITSPDTKFDKLGTYHTKLRLNGEQADALKSQVQEAADAAAKEEIANADSVKKQKVMSSWEIYVPFEADLDDQGEPNGDTLFRFKQRAQLVREGKETLVFSVGQFDAAGKAFTQEIWGGSEMKVCFEIIPIKVVAAKLLGVQLRLVAVQVIDLKTKGSGDAKSYGFQPEAGGFESETESAPVGAEESESTDETNAAPSGDF